MSMAAQLRAERKAVLLACAQGGLSLKAAIQYADYMVPEEKIAEIEKAEIEAFDRYLEKQYEAHR